jgi:hypothetical protein
MWQAALERSADDTSDTEKGDDGQQDSRQQVVSVHWGQVVDEC